MEKEITKVVQTNDSRVRDIADITNDTLLCTQAHKERERRNEKGEEHFEKAKG